LPDKVKFLVAMTQAQRDKLKMLGGAKWVRAQIDCVPDTKKSLSKPSKPPKIVVQTAHTTKRGENPAE
jgi:hypothetical protein